MSEIIYTLETVAQMLREHEKKAADEERERILSLIDKELEDWNQVTWGVQAHKNGALEALRTTRFRISEGKE